MSTKKFVTSPHVPDLDALRAWLEKMVTSMRLVELVVAVVALVTRMRDINTELAKQLAGLREARPRSEKLRRVERQLLLAFGGEGKPAAEQQREETDEDKPKPKRKRGGGGRGAFPQHYPRVKEENLVPPEMRICPVCSSEMKTVGFSICDCIDVIPAQVIVRQRHDETVACPHDDAIVSAPIPGQIVERGKLGTGLIVEATCDKYIEHLPIERQCTRWRRAGVPIEPQTLGRSVAAHLDLLEPVAKAIWARTRGPGVLGTDTTGLPVLDREAPDGIRSGSMACWTNARWVSFFYSPHADSASVRDFLGEDLARSVQCDGTNITSFLERAGGKRPGCWSHGRRRLVEAARGGDLDALEGLRIIRRLFEIERVSTREGDTAEVRKARRGEHSAPVLDELRGWIDEKRESIPPKTPFGRGLGYLHRQWKRLVLFLEDGNIEITNNRRERELRRLVLGRGNWLFVCGDLGGERTSWVLTVVGTALAHDVSPRAYLHIVTKLLLDGWPQSRIDELLPDRIGEAHPELDVNVREIASGAGPPLIVAPA